jgi:hypothetical protein
MANDDRPTFEIVGRVPNPIGHALAEPDPIGTYLTDPDPILEKLAPGETLVLGQPSNEPIDLEVGIKAIGRALDAGHSVQIVLLDP